MKTFNIQQANWGKILKVFMLIAIVILASLCFQQCENNKLAETTINNLLKENTSYKLKNGLLVESNAIASLDKKTLEENIIEKDAQLKEMAKKFYKITAVQTIKTKTTIPKTVVAFKYPITITEIDTVSGELKFKREGAYFSDWFEFGYVVTQDSLTIEPFNTWTEIKRVDGFKRKWFLGKKTYTSDVVFTNPYINTEELKTYEVAVPVKWYETTLVKVAAGFILGTIIIK
jgi:hypothetical protein